MRLIIPVEGIAFLFIIEISFGMWFGGLVTDDWGNGPIIGVVSATLALFINAVAAMISIAYPNCAAFVTAIGVAPGYILSFILVTYLVQNRRR